MAGLWVSIQAMIKTTTLVALAGAALTIGTSLAPAASATTAGDPYRCVDGNVCVWQDPGYAGGLAQFGLVYLNYQNAIYDNGLGVNDTVTSIFNRTRDRINFYRNSGANIRDLCFTVEPGASVYNLAGSGCDDAISSHYSVNL
ncbi:peptidase inhibitor family I36 protein [Amycolatopsis sp. NPDC059657]|uniref:peptidase inhibitor family I36 protein n=1 Tax=Amycolatopsis sp. NPDC059657 TaxID=3346899 RepID=UPI00366E0B47